jgi:hypothetical protein
VLLRRYRAVVRRLLETHWRPGGPRKVRPEPRKSCHARLTSAEKAVIIEACTTVLPELDALKVKGIKLSSTKSKKYLEARKQIIDAHNHLFLADDGVTQLSNKAINNRIKSWKKFRVVTIKGTPTLHIEKQTLETGVIGKRNTKEDATETCTVIVPDKESLGPLLHDCHTTLLNRKPGHHLSDTMFEVLRNKYAHINRDMCDTIVSCCPSCMSDLQSVPDKAKAGHTPVPSKRAMERVQIDLICLASALPDSNDGFKYILTVKDHFSAFVWLAALKTKQRTEVMHHLTLFFSLFGAPQIIPLSYVTQLSFICSSNNVYMLLCRCAPNHPK